MQQKFRFRCETIALIGAFVSAACSSRMDGETQDSNRELGTIVTEGPDGPTEITYEVVDGHAYVGGDIDLGPANELDYTQKNVGLTSSSTRWPNKTIPYTMDTTLSNAKKSQITSAMQEWTAKAGFTFTAVNTSTTPRVNFANTNGCSSGLGQPSSGVRTVQVSRVDSSGGDTCPVGSIMHELGHTIGLGHTHQQCNRDNFLIYTPVDPNNPDDTNYGKLCGSNYADYSRWDTQSIMHYGSWDGNGNVVLTLNDATLTTFSMQRNGLSDGDVQAVREMYEYLLRPPLLVQLL